MTCIDIDGMNAEADSTIACRAWRGLGLGTAAMAAPVLALLTEDVARLRTGASADNVAILTANSALGYVRDEE